MRIIALLFLLVFLSSCSTVPSSSLEQKRSELEKIINTGINGEKAKVTVSGNTIRAQISNQILFDFDKYQVKTPFQGKINRLAVFLKKNPSMTLIIEGHTDKTGKKSYNKSLSIKRANAVKSIFSRYGIAGNRIRSIGYGEERPLHGATNKQNRRVEIIFLDKKSQAVQKEEKGLFGSIIGAVTKATEASSKSTVSKVKKAVPIKKKDNSKLVQIKAGFDKGTAPSSKIKNTIPWYPIGGTDYLKSDLPIIVAGISKDKKSHNVEVKVTLEVDRHTRYVQCITFLCSPPEDNTDTYTKTISIRTKPNKVTEERATINNVELEGKRQGYVYYQGKIITVTGSRISFDILSVD